MTEALKPLNRIAITLAAILAIALLPAPSACAQDAPPTETPAADPSPTQTSEADPRYATPRKTMFTYLEGVNNHLDPTLSDAERAAALTEALNAFEFRNISDRPLQREMALRLLQILNRISRVFPSHFPSNIEGETFTYFPQDRLPAHARIAPLTKGRIVLIKTDAGEWRFSNDTVEGLNGMFRDLERLPEQFGDADTPITLSMRIRAAYPRWAHEPTILDIEWWQWITLAAIIFLGLLLDFFAQVFLRNAWSRIDRARRVESNDSVVKKAVRPFGMLAAAILWYWSLQLLGLPAGPLAAALIAVRLILIFAAVRAAFRLVDLGAEFLAARAEQTDTKLDDLLIPLLRRTVKILLVAFGAIYIAESFDVEILPLLTGLGIGGLALGLAAKDSIENFFGSVAVIMDSPFEVGDWIVVGDVEGTVEELGLRSTRVRTCYNSVVSVPNATLVRATVDNYGRRQYRRYTTRVGIRYDTPPDTIEAFCEAVRELVRQHPYTRKDYYHVWLNAFGQSGLEVLVYIFFECPDWGTELRERHRFILDMLRIAERLGVSYAFPTRTIEFTNTDLLPPTDPAPNPARDAEMSARQSGLQATRELTNEQSWKEIKPEPVRFDRIAPGLKADGPAGDNDG